jgi:hypothetical protein
MQSRKNIYNYIGLLSAIAVSAALGLSAGPGFAWTPSAIAQSDKNPHAWGLTAADIAVAPATQSEKTPHSWGLTPVDIAVAPATQSDKNPSYGRFWVTRLDQAARLWSSLCWATPSVNVTPSMTRGNWFVPLSLRHFFDAALTRVKTMSLAVFCDSAPLVRTVR